MMTGKSRYAVVALALLLVALLASNAYLGLRLRALESEVARAGALATGQGEEIGRLGEQVADAQAAASAARVAAADAAAEARGATSRLTALYIALNGALEGMAGELAVLSEQEFVVTVPVEEEIAIDTSIPFQERFEVPVDTSLPVNTTVTLAVPLGPLGVQEVEIPVRTTIPLNFSIPAVIETEIPIETTVPVAFDVPVTLSIAGSPLAEQLAGWQTTLRKFAEELR